MSSWLEQKLFLGNVVREYGTIHEEQRGWIHITTSVFLCQRDDRLQLMFRNLRTAPFAFRVHYTEIDITTDTLRMLGDILLDAHKHVDSSSAP
jgi:hypothetical protein